MFIIYVTASRSIMPLINNMMRSNDKMLLDEPKIKSKTYGSRVFCLHGPTIVY